MLPYLPHSAMLASTTVGRRWHCLMAPPAPPQVPSCFVRPQRPRMRDATTMARAVRRASARCGASPRPGSRPRHAGAPLGAGQPGTPSCWPLMVEALVCHRTPLRETRGYGSRRSPLVPWGEIPLYLGEKSPCTLGRNTLYLGEKSPCTSWRRGLGPPGEVPCTLRRNSMT